MTSKTKREHYDCTCFNEEHTMFCTLNSDFCPDYPPALDFSFFLQAYPKYICIPNMPFIINNIFNTFIVVPTFRIWTAIKYIFGYKSKYGHFDIFSLRVEDADRLITLIEEFKRLNKENKNANQ